VNRAWAAAVNDYKKSKSLPRVSLSEGRGELSLMNERRLLMQCESLQTTLSSRKPSARFPIGGPLRGKWRVEGDFDFGGSVNCAWAAAANNDYKKSKNLPRVSLSEGRSEVSVMNERRLLMQCESLQTTLSS
jgi:hypothetical protein